MRFCRFMEMCRKGGAARQPQRTEPCQCVCGQPWAYHGALQAQMQPLQCAAGVMEPALGAVAGLGRWFMGVVVLRISGVLQMRRQCCSATTAHIALPVCVWSALVMPWATAKSDAGSAVCSRRSRACTGCYGRAGQVICGGCSFAGGLLRVPEEKAGLGNNSLQGPASV